MKADTRDAFAAHALVEYPKECCGVVIVRKGKEQYVPCANEASDPSEHFIMSASDYAKAEDEGEVIAVVHSHPDATARPSEGDRAQCEATGVLWAIVSVMADENGIARVVDEYEWEPSGYEVPLVGRPFQHGTLDCYGLVRDWYKREAGIDLPDILRHDQWWNDGHSNLYMDNLEANGFIVVGQYPELQRGDMILMEVLSKNGVPNHSGVYLGDGRMLHHAYGRLSSIDEYMGYWRKVTHCVARHKDIQHG